MALPASGQISMSQVNAEWGISPVTTQVSLNDDLVRALFNKTTGAISMSDGYGKVVQIRATGGTKTRLGDYMVHSFTSTGTFTVDYTANAGYSVKITLVGSGDGGLDGNTGDITDGGGGGNGGNGQKINQRTQTINSFNVGTSYTATVPAGGVANGSGTESTLTYNGGTWGAFDGPGGISGATGGQGAGGGSQANGTAGSDGIFVSWVTGDSGYFSAGGGGGGAGANDGGSPGNGATGGRDGSLTVYLGGSGGSGGNGGTGNAGNDGANLYRGHGGGGGGGGGVQGQPGGAGGNGSAGQVIISYKWRNN